MEPGGEQPHSEAGLAPPARRRYRIYPSRNSGWSATDARARRVPLFPVGLRLIRKEARPAWMDEATFDEIRFSHWTRGWRLYRWITLGVLILSPFLAVGILLLRSKALGPLLVMPVIMFSAVGLLMPVMLHNLASKVFRGVASAHLKAGRCPSCAKVTLQEPADSDGCTTCSNCAAAWDLTGRDKLKVAWLPSLGRPALVTGDARGRMIEVFSHGRWASDASGAASMTSAEVREIRKEALAASPLLRKRRRATAIGVVIAAAYMSLIIYQRGARFPLIFWVIWFGSILFGAALAWRTMGDDPRRIIDIMLRRKRCPVCTYSIEGLPVHEDGCVVCPECASAWKTAPVEVAANGR